jgi:hypothetical protein
MPAFPLANALPPRNIRRLRRIQQRQLANANQVKEVEPLVMAPPAKQPLVLVPLEKPKLSVLQSYILRKQAEKRA